MEASPGRLITALHNPTFISSAGLIAVCLQTTNRLFGNKPIIDRMGRLYGSSGRLAGRVTPEALGVTMHLVDSIFMV